MFLSNNSYSSAICVKANPWKYLKEHLKHINNIQRSRYKGGKTPNLSSSVGIDAGLWIVLLDAFVGI